MLSAKTLLVALAALASTAHAQALHEPADGRLYLGAWLDTADSAPGAGDGDRPVLVNRRLGFQLGSFQYAQNIPIDTFPFPIEQVEATGNNALIQLAVYPRPSPWAITDDDISVLARQCGRINSQGRRILIRFGAEMNGNWNYWGQQPTQFRALWRRVHAALRRDAPQTGLVWAPSSGNGYPYREITRGTVSADDFALMDTNGDGVVNAQDDPYSPYYPGDEFVDWIGVSIYHYGPTFPWQDNTIAPLGKFEDILNLGSLYRAYAVAKNKPLMIAETASAFHVNSPTGPGVGELATKQPWWRQYITNATFLDTYPKVKLICMFEFRKFEEVNTLGQPDDRDFRITNKTEILNAFLQDFAAVRSRYIEAVPLAPSGTVSGGAPAPTGSGSAPAPSTSSNTTKNAGVAQAARSFVGTLLVLLSAGLLSF